VAGCGGDVGKGRRLTSTPAPVATPKGFLNSVLWSWLGVSASIVSAFILSPFIIRKLGDANYGLWALTTSLVEYYWLLDFGLRSATFQYTATYNATSETGKINEIVNTNLAYSLLLVPPIVGGAWFGAPYLARFMHVDNPLFSKLILIVVTSWALTALLSVFSTVMEGIQRFDITNQATVVSIAVRSIGTAVLLIEGYGVVAMAWMGMGAQILMHLISYWRARRVLPFMSFSPRFCSLSMFRSMIRYGAHSVMSSMAQRILSQSPPLLIGYMLPTRFVGYYTAPMRLLDYTAVTVMRFGNIANGKAAALVGTGRRNEVIPLAVMVNQYSLALFLPFSIFLLVYGPQLLAVWITPPFAREASGVLVALVAGITLGNAAQFSSNAILFGIGKHQRLARALLAEAAVTTAAMAFLLPRYGLTAAAIAGSVAMVGNRALFTPWLLTQELGASYMKFLADVNRPLLAVIPVALVLVALKRIVPGNNWPQLFLAGTVTLLAYTPFAYRFVLDEHKAMLMSKLRGLTSRFSRAEG
jgi:O-antigen/teichoic acid export membrane protein